MYYTLLVVLMVFVGVGLLLMEMFLLPGFGVGGVMGFLSLMGAVVVAYACLGAAAGHVTFFASVILSALAIYGFFKSRAIEKMGLDKSIESKVTLAKPGKKIENLEKDAKALEKSQMEAKASNAAAEQAVDE